MSEHVVHPSHYLIPVRVRLPQDLDDAGRPKRAALHDAVLEVKDLIHALGGKFDHGNAVKYLLRAGRKTQDPLDDLRKARQCIEEMIYRLELEAEEGAKHSR